MLVKPARAPTRPRPRPRRTPRTPPAPPPAATQPPVTRPRCQFSLSFRRLTAPPPSFPRVLHVFASAPTSVPFQRHPPPHLRDALLLELCPGRSLGISRHCRRLRVHHVAVPHKRLCVPRHPAPLGPVHALLALDPDDALPCQVLQLPPSFRGQHHSPLIHHPILHPYSWPCRHPHPHLPRRVPAPHRPLAHPSRRLALQLLLRRGVRLLLCPRCAQRRPVRGIPAPGARALARPPLARHRQHHIPVVVYYVGCHCLSHRRGRYPPCPVLPHPHATRALRLPQRWRHRRRAVAAVAAVQRRLTAAAAVAVAAVVATAAAAVTAAAVAATVVAAAAGAAAGAAVVVGVQTRT
eukprot:1694260-Rhodomonas_salina.2